MTKITDVPIRGRRDNYWFMGQAKDFRCKLTAADANLKNTYNDEALFLILSRSLPTEYATTIDTLAIQSTMSVDDKLKHLEAKEVRVQEQTAKEHAHAAFKSSNKYLRVAAVRVRTRRRIAFSSSSDEHKVPVSPVVASTTYK
jgi:hypothetical protein